MFKFTWQKKKGIKETFEGGMLAKKNKQKKEEEEEKRWERRKKEEKWRKKDGGKSETWNKNAKKEKEKIKVVYEWNLFERKKWSEGIWRKAHWRSLEQMRVGCE